MLGMDNQITVSGFDVRCTITFAIISGRLLLFQCYQFEAVLDHFRYNSELIQKQFISRSKLI